MTPVVGIIASSNQQGRSVGSTGNYFALASITLTDLASSVVFAGIPQEYSELQIFFTAYNNDTANSGLGNVRCSGFFNGDTTATNYYNHAMGGTGAVTFSSAENSAKSFGNAVRNSQTAPAINYISILDYAKPDKTTVVRTLTGFNNNDTDESNQGVRLLSGLWNNLDAVSSISIVPESGSFKANSKFTLFGVM